jgi:hypothetical protein
MKVSMENDNNFGYEKITIVVDNIPLTPGCIYTKMCQLKKKPIQCIMGFYIDLAGIAGRANCICKHERLRILLFHCKHQLDINNIRGEHRMDVLKIQGNIYRVNLLT